MSRVLQAVSISQPVMATLERKGFAGSVLSVFAGACNLVTDQGEIVTLVSQRVGNGPLNIVLEKNGFLSRGLKAGLSVEGDRCSIRVGEALVVSLVGAEVWESRLEWAGLNADRPGLKANLAVLHDHLIAQSPAESLADCISAQAPLPLATWRESRFSILSRPKRSGGRIEGCGFATIRRLSRTLRYASLLRMLSRFQLNGRSIFAELYCLLVAGPAGVRSLESTYRKVARRAIEGLLAALRVGDRQGIAAGATALAGLGPGLTPAGDDFLLGLMAGLRTWPQCLAGKGLSVEEACQAIYGAVAGKTNLLSMALLRSAREGMFGEAWHILLAALSQGKAGEVREAANCILGFGGTSGADALSGFLLVAIIDESGCASGTGQPLLRPRTRCL